MENSKIEWCDHTFNPWIGCTKVSDGCKNCYAEAQQDKRYGRVQWGPQGKRIRTAAANWRKPLAWNKAAGKAGKRARVFCASLADVFEDKPDQPEMDEWRAQLMQLIQDTPNLDWLLLTKRPESVMRLFDIAWRRFGGQPVTALPDNVWIGTSVENQEQADKRIPALVTIPAAVRFLSMEPLLGEVDLDLSGSNYGIYGIDWVIVGGESGTDARPMHPDWADYILDQCQEAGVPFFFKQWGEWLPVGEDFMGAYSWPGKDYELIKKHPIFWMNENGDDKDCIDCGRRGFSKVGKRAAGRLLDGREWNEFPKQDVS